MSPIRLGQHQTVVGKVNDIERVTRCTDAAADFTVHISLGSKRAKWWWTVPKKRSLLNKKIDQKRINVKLN